MWFGTSKIFLLLIVWFWVWGICPWDSSSAATWMMPDGHVQHDHQEAGETHHASKGDEHSCANPTLYSSSQFQRDRLPPLVNGFSFFAAFLGSPAFSASTSDDLPAPFRPHAFLPKLLTEYYQLYSNYRI